MISSHRRVVAVSLALLTVLGAVAALPALALEPDSGSTYARPAAPGATAAYHVVVGAQPGDSITQNGLKTVTLDYGADPDFSGSVAGVTARDVDVRVTAPGGNGTVPAGPVQVSTNPAGDRLTVTLLSTYQNVRPGTQIIVNVRGVRNTEIAIPDPQGPRGFALDVSASGPQGNTDGPVEVRYTIDPDATAPNATQTANASTQTTGTAAGQNATNTTTAAATETATANGTAVNGTAMNGTVAETSTTTTSTATQTATATATATATQTTTGGQQTETTGPGFGALAAVVALLAAALLATRRRD